MSNTVDRRAGRVIAALVYSAAGNFVVLEEVTRKRSPELAQRALELRDEMLKIGLEHDPHFKPDGTHELN